MKKYTVYEKILRLVWHYFVFFLMISFLCTCCVGLFVTLLTHSLGITLESADVEYAAKLTFINVLVLSLLFSLVDAVRRYLSTQRPLKKITEASEQMIEGNFDVRVEVSRFGTDATVTAVAEQFNRIAEELSGVETLRNDFIANVSHEMKTPLAVMQNYATLISAPDITDSERTEYAAAIVDASKRLSDMMTNVLKLNRLENQQIYPSYEKYDLGEQLCACLLQFESVWEQKNIEIETDIADEVTVELDPELMSLVWNNLFSNAFKFTGESGKVSVSLTVSAHHAIVVVSDNGCGMSSDVGRHIFEKFYQGDTSHASAGNGLGLALVKRVIDIMQAEISVESTVGQGSAFTVKVGRV